MPHIHLSSRTPITTPPPVDCFRVKLFIALFYLTVYISDPTLFHTEVKRVVYLRPQSSAGGGCWWYLSSGIVFAPRTASRHHPYLGGIFHQASSSHLVRPRATIQIYRLRPDTSKCVFRISSLSEQGLARISHPSHFPFLFRTSSVIPSIGNVEFRV
jgi:hypothetical protein